ncbi:MAG: hypothetical protein ACXVAY_10930 [Mucilaginibacter sp.]
MKNCMFALLACAIAICVLSCKKTATSYPAQINGKWRVVSDSTYNSFLMTQTQQRGYTGVSGDYYDFRTDGKLYTYESGTLDTLTYNIVNDTTIQIQSFGWVFNGSQSVSYLKYSKNNANVSIKSATALTPAGFGWRHAYLTR